MEPDHDYGNPVVMEDSGDGGKGKAKAGSSKVPNPGSECGYFGVLKSGKKFRVQIRSLNISISGFDTPEEAARKYDELAKIHHSAAARRLNFEDHDEDEDEDDEKPMMMPRCQMTCLFGLGW